jgi:hypothetical protein
MTQDWKKKYLGAHGDGDGISKLVHSTEQQRTGLETELQVLGCIRARHGAQDSLCPHSRASNVGNAIHLRKSAYKDRHRKPVSQGSFSNASTKTSLPEGLVIENSRTLRSCSCHIIACSTRVTVTQHKPDQSKKTVCWLDSERHQGNITACVLQERKLFTVFTHACDVDRARDHGYERFSFGDWNTGVVDNRTATLQSKADLV